MRAPPIPTESFALSIGLGALMPLMMMFALSRLPDSLISATIFLSPFVAGFVAGITFGAVQRPGIRGSLLSGVFAFLAFYSLVWIFVVFLGFRPSRELGIAMHVSAIFPPSIAAPAIISLVGSVFGWLAALALRR